MSRLPMSSYRTLQFTTDGLNRSFAGWAPVGSPPELDSLHERGWHSPLFELPVALEIVNELRQAPAGIVRAEYDALQDTVIIEESGNDPMAWPGIRINIGGESHTVYAIGNEEWEWSVIAEADLE